MNLSGDGVHQSGVGAGSGRDLEARGSLAGKAHCGTGSAVNASIKLAVDVFVVVSDFLEAKKGREMLNGQTRVEGGSSSKVVTTYLMAWVEVPSIAPIMAAV